MQIQKFTFNPFQENTYILYDQTNECIVIDPGMYTPQEEEELNEFIRGNSLMPKRLINTHCHLDHIFGNAFVHKHYDLKLEIHKGELPVLHAAPQFGRMYGIPYAGSPEPEIFLDEEDTITFGHQILKVIFTPGHSPASLSFYHEESKTLISGDVLFYESIGRTDLPGGNFQVLEASIKNKLFPLGDSVTVHPGHGPSTTIGHEKHHNPFL